MILAVSFRIVGLHPSQDMDIFFILLCCPMMVDTLQLSHPVVKESSCLNKDIENSFSSVYQASDQPVASTRIRRNYC